MENKRFTYEYDEYGGILFDNEYKTFYHIYDSEQNIKLLVSRLNKLCYAYKQCINEKKDPQCITLQTHMSDEDFIKIEKMLKKYFTK